MRNDPIRSNLERNLRRVREAIHSNLQQGALAEGSYAQDTALEFDIVRRLAYLNGARTYRVHLRCGHGRDVERGSYEEADMLRTGVIRCLSRTPGYVWTRTYSAVDFRVHTGEYVGVLGWHEGADSALHPAIHEGFRA